MYVSSMRFNIFVLVFLSTTLSYGSAPAYKRKKGEEWAANQLAYVDASDRARKQQEQQQRKDASSFELFQLRIEQEQKAAAEKHAQEQQQKLAAACKAFGIPLIPDGQQREDKPSFGRQPGLSHADIAALSEGCLPHVRSSISPKEKSQ